MKIFVLMALSLFSIQSIFAENPFSKFKGCYQIIHFSGDNSFSGFRPQTLEITHREKSVQVLPDGSQMSGLEFFYCINQGAVSKCISQTAYDNLGTYGISNYRADFFLYGGEACQIDGTLGFSCGSVLESISIKQELGLLKISGEVHSVMPEVETKFNAGYNALVKKIPLTDGLCR